VTDFDATTIDSPKSQRLCPVCGTSTEQSFCLSDGAQTVVLAPPDRDALSYRPGELVNDRYRITGSLGRGGFGAVYAAQHTGTQQAMALKMLTVRAEELSESAVKRFFREARITARLTDPNTVRVFDVGQAVGGPLFIAMELLRGPTLEMLLRSLEELSTPMTAVEAIDIAVPVLRSLAEAHANELVHRDLKPSNIVLARVGDGETTVKVLDFGVARTADSSLTAKGSTVGTPAYMSPEQVQAAAIDGRSDIYSLGIILFRCVAGALPFQSTDPFAMALLRIQRDAPDLAELVGDRVDAEFAQVISAMLSRGPDDRPSDARTLRKSLEAIRARIVAQTDGTSDELPLSDLIAGTGVAGPEDRTAESSPALDGAFRNKLLRRSATPNIRLGGNSTPHLKPGDTLHRLVQRATVGLDTTPSEIRNLLDAATVSVDVRPLPSWAEHATESFELKAAELAAAGPTQDEAAEAGDPHDDASSEDHGPRADPVVVDPIAARLAAEQRAAAERAAAELVAAISAPTDAAPGGSSEMDAPAAEPSPASSVVGSAPATAHATASSAAPSGPEAAPSGPEAAPSGPEAAPSGPKAAPSGFATGAPSPAPPPKTSALPSVPAKRWVAGAIIAAAVAAIVATVVVNNNRRAPEPKTEPPIQVAKTTDDTGAMANKVRTEAAILVKEAVNTTDPTRRVELFERAVKLDPDNVGYSAMLKAAQRELASADATQVVATDDAGPTSDVHSADDVQSTEDAESADARKLPQPAVTATQKAPPRPPRQLKRRKTREVAKPGQPVTPTPDKPAKKPESTYLDW